MSSIYKTYKCHKAAISIKRKDMNLNKYLIILSSFIILISCDPGLKGDLKIFNDTNQSLLVKYKDNDVSDTVYADIQPNDYVIVKILNGLGNKKTFDCCPCRMKYIFVTSTNGQVKKDPNNSDNWSIPNKGKLKKYGKEPIKCEFHVTQEDL